MGANNIALPNPLIEELVLPKDVIYPLQLSGAVHQCLHQTNIAAVVQLLTGLQV